MKLGTPGFQGDRLRLAREARGMTANSLAELIDVSRQAISKYENSQSSPDPSVMKRIEDVLRFPPLFFVRPIPETGESAYFFRSMSAATKTARRRAIARELWACELADLITQHIHLPVVDIPDLSLPQDPRLIGDDDIENAADKLRDYWSIGVGPVPNLVHLLETKGVLIIRTELFDTKLDAVSTWRTRPIVILGSDKESAARSRFDLAHELGHLVLHRSIEPNKLGDSSYFKRIEQQANIFAGAFLLPSVSFLDDVELCTLDEFQLLKHRWKVSVGLMIMRASQLELGNEESFKRLWINYNRRGWKRNEPLDDTVPPEKPRLLRQAIEMLVSQIGDRIHVLDRLGLNPSDIEALTGIPQAFWSVEENVILTLPTRSNKESFAHEREDAQILPFLNRKN